MPVAHEFSRAGENGSDGSEFSPVRPECPIAITPTGFAVLAEGAVDEVVGPAAA
jgi:hypothetical protein